MFKQRRNSEFVDAVEHAEHVAKPSNDEAKKSNVIWLDAFSSTAAVKRTDEYSKSVSFFRD